MFCEYHEYCPMPGVMYMLLLYELGVCGGGPPGTPFADMSAHVVPDVGGDTESGWGR